MSNSPYTFISDKIISALEWGDFNGTPQWCTENIIMSSEVSGRTGYLSFDKYPWSQEILEDWDRDNLEEYNMWASTQVAKTTIQFCCIASTLSESPCMVLFVMASDKMVSDFVSEKFDPFMEGIEVLKDNISVKQQEDKSRLKNAVKIVPGGRVSFVGNTAINRRGKTVKHVFMDEVALYEHGDVEEFKSRTKSFEGLGRKIFIVSSPMYNGDPILTAYDNSYCKKELHIFCEKCDNSFYPESKHFHYEKETDYKIKVGDDYRKIDYKREAIKSAHTKCPHCENKIYSKDLENYIREKRVKLVIVEGDIDRDTKVGYKLNALATGLTNYEKLAEKLIEAEDDDNKLVTIYREYFNEIFEISFAEKEQSDMFLLGNGVKEWIVPEDTIRIYLTIDNQMDHLYAQVTAIRYGVSPHIMFFGRIETWSQAEELWENCQHLEDKNGEKYMVSKMGIDRRGYNEGQISRTDEADQFVHYMTQKWGEDRIYGMEGHPTIAGGKVFTVGNHKDYSNQRRELKVKIIKFSNLYVKNQLFRSIDRSILKAKAESETDEGYDYEDKLFTINQCHIERDMEYTQNDSLTKMLTAEVFDYARHPKTGKLADTKSWIPIRKRNDAIDTSDMALVFADMDKLSMKKKPQKETISMKDAISGLGKLM